MEELLRSIKQKTKSNTTLPAITKSERTLQQIYNTENAFKLCRVGAKKSKFINFDLRYTQDENETVPPQEQIKIPMMVYNRNKFSPYKVKSTQKQPHLLLVSRFKQSEALPSIGRVHCNHHQTYKFTKPQQNSSSNPYFFIT